MFEHVELHFNDCLNFYILQHNLLKSVSKNLKFTVVPPIPPLIFKSRICLFLVIYDSLYRRFPIPPFFASPESGGIGGSSFYYLYDLIADEVYHGVAVGCMGPDVLHPQLYCLERCPVCDIKPVSM